MSTPTGDRLVSWLRSQLDADEQALRAAIQGYRVVELHSLSSAFSPPAVTTHAELPSTFQQLRTVAAHRAILERHARTFHFDEIWMCRKCGNAGAPCRDVRDLASIYESRAGFDPSWRANG